MKRVENVFCARMDHGGCGLVAHVDSGKISKIEGDPDSHTRGYICIKGRAHIERLNHPDRLRHPLKRIGKRGENRWKRISWNEALDTIAEKLRSFREYYSHRAKTIEDSLQWQKCNFLWSAYIERGHSM